MNSQILALKAEANHYTASKYHERLKSVGKEGVSASDIDAAAGSASQAKAEVAQAKAQLRLAQINLERTKIKAPITGQIGKAGVTKGNYATPAGGILASIVQVNPIRVSFALPDREYLRLQEFALSQKYEAYDAALRLVDGTLYPAFGEPDFADNNVDDQTGTIMMRLRFKNDQGTLLPGSMVRVEIVPSKPVMGILIPQEAVAADSEGDFVYVVNAGSIAHRQDITLGTEAGSMRQIISGLQEGDDIVLRGHQSVRDGMRVEPVR